MKILLKIDVKDHCYEAYNLFYNKYFLLYKMV